jgi:hypothetical protein
MPESGPAAGDAAAPDGVEAVDGLGEEGEVDDDGDDDDEAGDGVRLVQPREGGGGLRADGGARGDAGGCRG